MSGDQSGRRVLTGASDILTAAGLDLIDSQLGPKAYTAVCVLAVMTRDDDVLGDGVVELLAATREAEAARWRPLTTSLAQQLEDRR